MKPALVVFSFLGLVFIAIVLRQFAVTTGGPVPWWIYLIYLAIIFCGFMYLRTRQAEEKAEQKLIEEEGEKILKKYMEKRQQ